MTEYLPNYLLCNNMERKGRMSFGLCKLTVKVSKINLLINQIIVMQNFLILTLI